MRGARSMDKPRTDMESEKMSRTVSSASEGGQSLSPLDTNSPLTTFV